MNTAFVAVPCPSSAYLLMLLIPSLRSANNARSESWDRVTPQTYVGTVEALFEVAAG